MIGHVKFFNIGRRYGFILPDGKTYKDRADVFFHEDTVEGGIRGTIEDGTEVEYEVIPTNKGKALTVRRTGRAYAPIHELRKGAAHGAD